MANIIDDTFFVGSINIDFGDDSALLDLCIKETEEKYLKLLLGLPLYATYKSDTTAQIWRNLIEGETEPVKIDGYEVIYDGLKNMLANFTYYHYIQDYQSLNTNIGERMPDTENSSPAFNIGKIVKAYNKAIEDYKIAKQYMKDSSRSSSYPLVNDAVLDEINIMGI